jgi:hypothetical protein
LYQQGMWHVRKRAMKHAGFWWGSLQRKSLENPKDWRRDNIKIDHKKYWDGASNGLLDQDRNVWRTALKFVRLRKTSGAVSFSRSTNLRGVSLEFSYPIYYAWLTRLLLQSTFLDAFAKLRKATISFVMFVCLSVCPSVWNNPAPTGLVLIKLDVEALCKSSSFIKIWQ